jgi:carbamoyltransferase
MVATSRRLGGETIRTATTWWSPTAAMRPDRAARYQVFSATTTFRLDPDVERHVGSANGSSVGGVALRWLYAFEDSVFPFRGRSTNVFDYAVFAADVQATLVECGLALAERLHCCSGAPALLLAGGGALNAHMNRDLAASGLWQAVAGTAAPHDAGAAVGAGFLAARLVGDQVKPRAPGTPPPIFLGPPVSGGDIEAALDRAGVDAGGRDDVFDVAATTLGRGGLVAWFEGSDEFGPRPSARAASWRRPIRATACTALTRSRDARRGGLRRCRSCRTRLRSWRSRRRATASPSTCCARTRLRRAASAR